METTGWLYDSFYMVSPFIHGARLGIVPSSIFLFHRSLFVFFLICFVLQKLLTRFPCPAKITELDYSIFRQKKIFRFDISMKTVVGVEVVQSLQGLPDDALYCGHWNTFWGKEKIMLCCMKKL